MVRSDPSRTGARWRGLRWLAWALLALVAFGAALAYRHFWLGRPTGAGGAGPLVPYEPFGHVWSRRKVLLLGVVVMTTGGNDIIHAYGRQPPREGAMYGATLDQARPWIAAFLGHGIHCRQFWRRHYQVEDPTYWYAPNLEDPTERGYDALRRIFLLEMLKADLHQSDQAARTQATKASSPPGALTPVGYPT